MMHIQRLTWHLLHKLSVLDLQNLHNIGAKQYSANIFVVSVQFPYSATLESTLPRLYLAVKLYDMISFLIQKYLSLIFLIYPSFLDFFFYIIDAV